MRFLKKSIFTIKSTSGETLYETARAEVLRMAISYAIEDGVSLEHANLSGGWLLGGDFRGGNFRGANFGQATMDLAELTSADLRETTWVGAKMENVILREANCAGVSFAYAEFGDTAFRKANLEKADFRDVIDI
jgi:uncharacterized protein YjbI with pentapeptide repeats